MACIRAAPARSRRLPDAEGSHRVPGYLPQLLPRAPNSACLFHGDAQIGMVLIDADSDKIMVVAIWLAGAATPRLNREAKDVLDHPIPL